MLIETQPKYCRTCNKSIRGRTDKKFCDDYCRNAFNNRLKAEDNNTIRKINNALRKNRRILAQLLQGNEKTMRVSREELLDSGFQFKYITHMLTNPKGKRFHFCYEYGFLSLENNRFLIVKQKEE